MTSAASPTIEKPAREGSPALDRFVVDAPRYTSYPTAAQFDAGVGADDYAEALTALAARDPEGPLSLYVHLPFCKALCDFCGCHAMLARGPERIGRYLAALGREMVLVAERLTPRLRVTELHFGGGSPSLLEASDFDGLMASLRAAFRFDPGFAGSIEVDPRTVTDEKFAAYRRGGLRRVSMGFQDLDEGVQEAIGRHQSRETSRRAFAGARAAGFDGINVDICYGLPTQTAAGFERTVAEVAELGPDRISVFGYAHVPWLKPLQKRIAASTLPDSDLRLGLLGRARQMLIAAGYRAIGLDHFARPGDELARAADEGRLHRNFQGYTVTATDTLVGLGLSAISDVGALYAQNHRTLAKYHAAIEAGRLPTERGVRRTAEDVVRAEIIKRLMCAFELDGADVGRTFGFDFAGKYAAEMGELGRMAEQGLLGLEGTHVTLTPLGRTFVRNVAQVFDAYRHGPTAGRHSKSV